MAGCCHGKPTNAWYGISMDTGIRSVTGEVIMQKVVPTQLFETIFLLIVFLYLVSRIKDNQTYCLQFYMCIYGVWRFIIEYLRDDYRGTTVIDSLTPSQFTALLMVLGGIMLIFLQKNIQAKFERVDTVTTADTSKSSADEAYEYEEEYDYDYNTPADKKEDNDK